MKRYTGLSIILYVLLDPAVRTSTAKTEEPLFKPSEVTTFIFNGEEFVQMPKRVYLAERDHLESQLRVYKELISNLKNQLASVMIDEI